MFCYGLLVGQTHNVKNEFTVNIFNKFTIFIYGLFPTVFEHFFFL